MNIFFKLLAICGLGGSIGGTTYLSQQSYTNIHDGAVVAKRESKIPDGGVSVRTQPGATKAPEQEPRQEGSGESDSTAGGAQVTQGQEAQAGK